MRKKAPYLLFITHDIHNQEGESQGLKEVKEKPFSGIRDFVDFLIEIDLIFEALDVIFLGGDHKQYSPDVPCA